ncbi:MAG: potassium/proton antiporter [Verrucomicrobia bacterium]|nr:MAG: potassium/proton antiporter [Verrucomicrobiota bacterium]
METAHELILLGGALGLISIFAGVISSRFNAPLLLVFLLLGMLAGEDGPGRIQFADFRAAYLIGSIALAIILFEGGLKTERRMIEIALWPSLVLATIGVAITALFVGVAAVWLFKIPFTEALLIGAVLAPTDAAAVNTLLRDAGAAVPDRVKATLEVESGLNDPTSVFLTILLVESLMSPQVFTGWNGILLFVEEMLGGAVLGLLAGYALLFLVRKLKLPVSMHPVLALASVLVVFGGAQLIGASGFLAVYLMGLIVGVSQFESQRGVVFASETFAWLAQISLFLMLGLLVTPHELLPLATPVLLITAVLIFLARPFATFACLMPFRFTSREMTFASWVGLRGAVPIYLAIVPVLAGFQRGTLLFAVTFGVVIVSLLLQGWTISPFAWVVGFGNRSRPPV